MKVYVGRVAWLWTKVVWPSTKRKQRLTTPVVWYPRHPKSSNSCCSANLSKLKIPTIWICGISWKFSHNRHSLDYELTNYTYISANYRRLLIMEMWQRFKETWFQSSGNQNWWCYSRGGWRQKTCEHDRQGGDVHSCGAIQFAVLPPPRTPKRSGKTGDRSVSDELRRERMKLTVSRSSLYYKDWMWVPTILFEHIWGHNKPHWNAALPFEGLIFNIHIPIQRPLRKQEEYSPKSVGINQEQEVAQTEISKAFISWESLLKSSFKLPAITTPLDKKYAHFSSQYISPLKG
jgi:hypothetical protein